MPIDKYDDDDDEAQALLDAEDGEEFLRLLPTLATPLDSEEWNLERDGENVSLHGYVQSGALQGVYVPPCSLTLDFGPDPDDGNPVPLSAEATIAPYEMNVRRNYEQAEWSTEVLAIWRALMDGASGRGA